MGVGGRAGGADGGALCRLAGATARMPPAAPAHALAAAAMSACMPPGAQMRVQCIECSPGVRGAPPPSPARMAAVGCRLCMRSRDRCHLPSARVLWHCRRGDAELVSGPAGERPDWWWSGPKPVEGTAGVQPDGTITSLPLPNLASCTRQQVSSCGDAGMHRVVQLSIAAPAAVLCSSAIHQSVAWAQGHLLRSWLAGCWRARGRAFTL